MGSRSIQSEAEECLGGVEIEVQLANWQARALGKDWFKNDYNSS